MITLLAEVDSDLAAELGAQGDRLDLDLIGRAYRLSATAHRGQKRLSGEAFISHAVEVGIQYRTAIHVARRTAHRLDQRPLGSEKSLMVRVENGNERDLRKIQSFA